MQTPPSPHPDISFCWIHCVCSLKLILVTSYERLPPSHPPHLASHPSAKPLCSCVFWNILCLCTLSRHTHTLPLLPLSCPMAQSPNWSWRSWLGPSGLLALWGHLSRQNHCAVLIPGRRFRGLPCTCQASELLQRRCL